MATIFSGGTVLLSVITLILLVRSRVTTSKVPPSVPWAGLGRGAFSKTRACIRELTAGLRTLKIGYDQFNRKGLPCVIPDPGFRPVVMVPQEHVSWMCDKSDNVFSAIKTEVERRAFEYLLPTVDLTRGQFIHGVIRKDLTRSLGKMHPAIFEETRSAIDIEMGRDTDGWKEVRIKTCVEAVAFRTNLRVLMGSPLCNNEEYVSSTIAFSNWLGGAAIIVAQMPWILKAFFGYLGALPVYYYQRKAFKFLVPVIRDRMANLKRMRDNPSFKFEPPDDLITWATQASIESTETVAKSPEHLAVFMLILSLAAIPTTVLTATNTMLDLVSSDHDANFWGQLSEEATEVFKTPDDWINPASLLKLSLADSTIRESLRKNPIIARSVVREVIADEGIMLPSGHLIPKGAWMCAGAVDLHHDSRFYPKPEEYDPFRFAKKQEDGLTEADKETLTAKASIYRKNQALVTTSDIFLSFGYGRHACPGRWLAAHQLKLMLAYITMNYDIQHMAQRPANYVLGDAIIPSDTATMKVRRRKHT